jgi:multiple sugar transport system substrate-binding protein
MLPRRSIRRTASLLLHRLPFLLVLLLATGCPPNTKNASQPDAASDSGQAAPSERESAAGPLRVLAIDSPDLAHVIQRQWLAHSQSDLSLTMKSTEEVLNSDASVFDVDVVVFPTTMLGTLAVQRRIVAWPLGRDEPAESTDDIEADYRWEDILPLLRREELRWGDAIFGVPFGSPNLMLLYRADLLERWQLSVPRTWEQYQAVVDAARQRLTVEGEQEAATSDRVALPEFATLEPLGPHFAARTFLARAASYARHPNQYSTLFQFSTLDPWIDQPPFERALKELAAVAREIPTEQRMMTPTEVMEAMLAGKTVMGLTWPGAARNASSNLPADARIEMSVLPGSTEVFQVSSRSWEPHRRGNVSDDSSAAASRELPVVSTPLLGVSGRIGAVSRRARSIDAATSFLMWLTRAEQAARISAASQTTTAFRHSSLTQPSIWVEPALQSAAGTFVRAMNDYQQSPQSLTLLRIPGQDEYLGVLDEAVRGAIDGSSDAAVVLSEVKAQWKTITEQLGRDAQRNAYLQSLGLELSGGR